MRGRLKSVSDDPFAYFIVANPLAPKHTQIFPNLKQFPDFVIIPSKKEIIIINFVSPSPHYGRFICAFLLPFPLVFFIRQDGLNAIHVLSAFI